MYEIKFLNFEFYGCKTKGIIQMVTKLYINKLIKNFFCTTTLF